MLLLVCEGVDHPVSESDGLNLTVGNDDVLDDVLDESTRYLGIYLADVLLVIDIAIFDELGDHDEVVVKYRVAESKKSKDLDARTGTVTAPHPIREILF